MKYLDKPWLKHYPDDVPEKVQIPEVPAYRLVDEAIKKYGDRIALVFYGTEISYRQLGEYIEKAASAFHELGIGKGSVVAIFVPTVPQFIISYYALQKLGATPTSVSFLYSPREVRLQLDDSGADTIIMIDLLYKKYKPILVELGIKRIILTDTIYFMPRLKKTLARALRRMPKANIPKGEPVYYFEDLIKREKVSYPEVEADVKEDVAAIIYTSGTTGAPKGIPLTHYNIQACIKIVEASSGDVFKEGSYLLEYLPLFHIYGQNVMMTGGLSFGQTLIVIIRPNFEELLKFVEKYKITMLFGVPAIYRIFIKLLKKRKYDLSTLKLCASGSDYTPQSLKDEWKELTGADITEGWGMTEACPGTGTLIGAKEKTGSVGLPLPSTIVAIADPEKDEFVKVGKKGEIIIRGPQVMKDYWRNVDNRYPNVFATIAKKKWLRTGDVGYMDRDGYFYMVERKKNIIKYKAHAIYPGEVENIINQYDPVQEAAVIGIPANDPEFGQFVKAFVALKDEYKGNTSREDIINYCRERLAVYKLPKKIQFVDALPRTSLGKVERKKLREESVAAQDTKKNH